MSDSEKPVSENTPEVTVKSEITESEPSKETPEAVEEETVAEGDQDEGDEDDDDDDEDDDDEDDDDEDERLRSKKRRGNQFLDVEAEVDEEDEDEEEDDEEAELLKEEFLAADEQADVEKAARSHNKLERNREKIAEADAQALAEQFRQRYGRSTQRYVGSGNVSQRLLLPTVNDPSIWGIRVRNGREKAIVQQLYARMFNMKGTELVYSAFQRDDYVGYIYVEARRVDAVDRILAGIPGVYASSGKTLVPIEEYPDLLRPGHANDVQLQPGSYVRVKSGRYKGDLGIVDNLSDNDLEVRVKLVPRLDYGRGERGIKPQKKLFSVYAAQQYDPQHLSTARPERDYYVYKNDEYEGGFLFKDIGISHLQTKVQPTLGELQMFKEGIDVAKVAKLNKASAVFQPGDRVIITGGEQSGLRGKVISAAQEKIVEVVLEDEGQTDKVEVPVDALRKLFLPGDHVTVARGAHEGEQGMVVRVQDQQVTLVSDQTSRDVTVFSNYLVRSSEPVAEVTAGGFNLHQLVHINAQEVGIVLAAEKDALTILRSDGRVIHSEPEAIQSAVQTDRNTEKTTDRAGNEIKIGDVVREARGEKRTGTALHIYKDSVFVKTRTDVFVVDSEALQAVSTKGISSGPDLSRMNPTRMGAPSQSFARPQMATGRDPTVNQYVSVRKGPYKGKRGLIRDAQGDTARVEMHNPAKTVPVKKIDLMFEVRPGNYIGYEQFVESRGRRGGMRRAAQVNSGFQGGFQGESGGPAPGSAGQQSPMGATSPMWSSTGGKTPSWGGSKTPGWGSSGGKTPSWGGKTPAWGSGSGSGGKTPSWGSSSTAGGKTPAWGGQTPSWGDNGSKSAWGGQSQYGGRSAWQANESANTNTSADWDAPTPAPKEDDYVPQ